MLSGFQWIELRIYQSDSAHVSSKIVQTNKFENGYIYRGILSQVIKGKKKFIYYVNT